MLNGKHNATKHTSALQLQCESLNRINRLLTIGATVQVVQEVQQGPNKQAILQADALKYITIFRAQLPKPGLLEIFPHVVALLKSESNVVHSYAAILIERLLASKVRPSTDLAYVSAVSTCLNRTLQAQHTNIFTVQAVHLEGIG